MTSMVWIVNVIVGSIPILGWFNDTGFTNSPDVDERGTEASTTKGQRFSKCQKMPNGSKHCKCMSKKVQKCQNMSKFGFVLGKYVLSQQLQMDPNGQFHWKGSMALHSSAPLWLGDPNKAQRVPVPQRPVMASIFQCVCRYKRSEVDAKTIGQQEFLRCKSTKKLMGPTLKSPTPTHSCQCFFFKRGPPISVRFMGPPV